MKNWLKNKLRWWLFPEYQAVQAFMKHVRAAEVTLANDKGDLTFNEPVFFMGSLSNCRVEVKPTLKPEIVLSKLDLSALSVAGTRQVVTGCYFSAWGTGVKVKGKGPSEKEGER